MFKRYVVELEMTVLKRRSFLLSSRRRCRMASFSGIKNHKVKDEEVFVEDSVLC